MPQRRYRSVDSYDSEEWSELREEFRTLARRLTEENDRFSKAEFVDRGWGGQLTEALRDEFEDEGRVYVLGSLGNVWISEPDEFFPRFGVSYDRLSEPHRERARSRVAGCAASKTEEKGFCTLKDVREELGLARVLAKGVLEDLEDRGVLMHLGTPFGYFDPKVMWDPSVDGARPYGSRIPLDSDRLDDLYNNVFLPRARSLTRDNGYFTVNGLKEEGIAKPVGRELSARACDVQDAERIVTKGGDRVFYRSLEVDPPDFEETSFRGGTIGQEYGRLCRDRIWELLEERGPLLNNELKSTIGAAESVVQEALDQLVDRGEVVHLGKRDGYALRKDIDDGRVDDVPTLLDLLNAVDAAPVAEGTPCIEGAESRHDPEAALHSLTKSHKDDISTLVNSWIGKHIGPPENIVLSSPLFSWHPEEGDWELRRRLRDLGAYPKMLSAARTLRLFAFAKDFVDWDEERIWAANRSRYAPGWKPTVDEWRRIAVETNGGNRSDLFTGVRRLAIYASHRGEVPDEVRWQGIKSQLIRDRNEDRLTKSQFESARRAYDVLQQEGVIDAPRWKLEKKRLSLLPQSAALKAADDGDWSGWLSEDFDLSSLVEGQYGFRLWRRWSTAPSWKLKGDERLPERTWPGDFNPSGDPASYFHTEESTTQDRFRRMSRLLGYIRRKSERNVEELTPIEFADPYILDGLADEVRQGTGIDMSQPNPPYPPLVHRIATDIASFLIFIELQGNEQGDKSIVNEAREAREHIDSFRNAVEANSAKTKDLSAIRAAWRGKDGRAGWVRTHDLVDLLIEEVETSAAGVSLERQAEQLLELNDGTREEVTFDRTKSWARRLREAVVFTIHRRLPLRPAELSALTLEMWQEWGGASENWPKGPWAGALGVDVPGRLMKRNTSEDDSYQAAFIPSNRVGEPEAEAGTRRALLFVWFVDGGARDRLLTDAGGSVRESPYLIPGEASAVNAESNPDCKWNEGSLRRSYTSVILRHARALGMSRARLDALHGATSPHVMRALYGTYWADEKGRIIAASERLHHTTTETTIEKYVVHDPRQSVLEDLQGGQETSHRSEVERLRDQNEELREQLGKLQEQNEQLRQQVSKLPDLEDMLEKMIARDDS